MKNLGQMLKQAQQMQKKMTEIQETLARSEITGQSGGGLVAVTLTGKGEARAVSIDPSLLEGGDPEALEDLMRAAINDAAGRLEALKKELMADLTGGLPLPPGMQLPF